MSPLDIRCNKVFNNQQCILWKGHSLEHEWDGRISMSMQPAPDPLIELLSCWHCNKPVDPDRMYSKLDLCQKCTLSLEAGLKKTITVSRLLIEAAVIGTLFHTQVHFVDGEPIWIFSMLIGACVTAILELFGLLAFELGMGRAFVKWVKSLFTSRWWRLVPVLLSRLRKPVEIEIQHFSPIEYDNMLTEQYKQKMGWDE